MEIDAQTAPFTTDSKEAGVVTRAKAIKLKDPGRLMSGLERYAILDHFLYLLHPPFIYMKTRINFASFFGALETIQ